VAWQRSEGRALGLSSTRGSHLPLPGPGG